MEQGVTLTRARLKAPRAGAIAGIVFSTLFIISLVLIRISVPANPLDAGTRFSGAWKTVSQHGFAHRNVTVCLPPETGGQAGARAQSKDKRKFVLNLPTRMSTGCRFRPTELRHRRRS